MVRRNDSTAKIDADVLRMAKVVAAYRDLPLAEYLTAALRPIVENDYRAQAEQALKEAPPAPGKPSKPEGRSPKGR